MSKDVLARMRNIHKIASTPMSLLLGVDEFFRDFDEMVDRSSSAVKSAGNFPPFNIRRKGDEYLIELALAGFSRDEIDVSLNKNKNILTITGNASDADGASGDLSDQVVSNVERMRILSGVSPSAVDKAPDLGEGDSGIPLSKVLGDGSSGGFAEADEEEKPEWLTLYRGIAKRKFYQEFKLPRAASIQSAKMENGMLCIHVALPQSEEKETISIEIE